MFLSFDISVILHQLAPSYKKNASIEANKDRLIFRTPFSCRTSSSSAMWYRCRIPDFHWRWARTENILYARVLLQWHNCSYATAI